MFHSGAVSGSHLLATIKLLSVVTAKKARGHGSRNKKKREVGWEAKASVYNEDQEWKTQISLCHLVSFFFCGVIKFKCTCIEGLIDPKKVINLRSSIMYLSSNTASYRFDLIESVKIINNNKNWKQS